VVIGALFVVGLCVFNFTVYVPLLVRTVLHLGPEGFGFLMAALGVGAVSGALALGARADPEPSIGLLLITAAVACSGLLGLSAVRQLGTSGSLRDRLLGDHRDGLQPRFSSARRTFRGRVMSLYCWVYGGVFPHRSGKLPSLKRHGV
jgi:hypothetical protein